MYDHTPTDFWEDFYASRPTPIQPAPNARLTESVADLTAGDALDLGSGNGGDAIWLARRGWSVTAIDTSPTAVERLNSVASALRLRGSLVAVRGDLEESFPEGGFDLISAHYLHTPLGLDRVRVLRTAAGALHPGGHLLVVDHGSTVPWSWNRDPDARFPHPEEVYEELELDPALWTPERVEAVQRTATGPGGQTAVVTDHVLLIRRTVH
ncbi:class I SAM-dependent methyltransferase [Spiractinospora alimapuensis]|uniref:class I SAM-dependent methyltransferase n=1 Tax=Spiractinospora alimapuensis TaxID=2820884 RepID=UPI001F1BC5DF|nr:class I SAM-dependent methyltransferase [Spiractinospora alimapuensis]QVQ52261.1 class I SAM-dependent methyltransferase [Spiractinospora alimapuensis]